MKTFKEFFIKSLIQESPQNTGVFETPYSDTRLAMDMYDEIMTSPQDYKKVHTLFDKHKVDLMLKQENNDMMLYFVPRNDKFIYGYATYELLPDGGVEMVGVYNRPMYFGLAQYVYREYILPTHGYIRSNGQHSISGRNFWRKLVIHFLVAGKQVGIWDMNQNKIIKSVSHVREIDDFYDDDIKYDRYRIQINN